MLIGLALRYLDVLVAVGLAAIFFVLVLIFRDPRRGIPASPLGIISPADGRVIEVDLADRGVLHGEAHRILIDIDSFGTYTARAPVEGKIMDLRSVDTDKVVDYRTNAMWIRTDEGDDVVLQFNGHRLGLVPRAFLRYGERVGQGQRCAFLRLTRIAEVQLPLNARIQVESGQRVAAGSDLLARLPHH